MPVCFGPFFPVEAFPKRTQILGRPILLNSTVLKADWSLCKHEEELLAGELQGMGCTKISNEGHAHFCQFCIWGIFFWTGLISQGKNLGLHELGCWCQGTGQGKSMEVPALIQPPCFQPSLSASKISPVQFLQGTDLQPAHRGGKGSRGRWRSRYQGVERALESWLFKALT